MTLHRIWRLEAVQTSSRTSRLSLAVLLAGLLVLAVAAPASAGDNTWTRIDLGKNLGGKGDLMSFAVAPSDPDLLLVGQMEAPSSSAMLRSANRGKDWEPIDLGTASSISVGVLKFSPVDANVAYAAVLANGPGTREGGKTAQESSLRKSTDGGRTWTSKVSGSVLYNIAVSPADPKVVYAGGAKMGDGAGAFHASRDGGETWTDLSKATSEAWVWFIAAHPTDPKVVVVGDDESLRRSTDGGQSWSKVALPSSVSGLSSIAFSADGRALYAASRGRLLRSPDTGATWRTVFSVADGGYIIVRPNLAAPSEVLFAVGARIYRSTEEGTKQVRLGANVPGGSVDDLVTDRGHPETVYARGGDTGVWAYTVSASGGSLPKSGDPYAELLPILAALAAALSLVGLRLRKHALS